VSAQRKIPKEKMMEKIQLEACTTCSLNIPKIRAVVEKWQSANPDTTEVLKKECLELCQDDCAFRLNGAKLFVPASGTSQLETKLNAALQTLKK
jgi:hypothetical protein